MPMIHVKITEGMLAEMENTFYDYRVWDNLSHFVIEAIDEKIKKTWKGNRYYHGQDKYEGERPTYDDEQEKVVE